MNTTMTFKRTATFLLILAAALSLSLLASENSSAKLTSKVENNIVSSMTRTGEFYDVYVAEVKFNDKGVNQCFVDNYKGFVYKESSSSKIYVCSLSKGASKKLYSSHKKIVKVVLAKGKGKNAKKTTYNSPVAYTDGTTGA